MGLSAVPVGAQEAPGAPETPETPAGPVEKIRVLVGVEPGAGLSRSAEVEASVAGELEVVGEFATSDYVLVDVAADVAPDVLDDLAASPRVTNVIVDQVATRALQGSVPLVNAPAQWFAGFNGAGATVAVLDDGVASTHPNLIGKVVAEACFTSPSGCAGQASSTGPGAGQPCSLCAHGTHVAGIAAGAGGGHDGVARGASIFSVRVFGSASGTAFFSDIALGLEHVLSRADDLDIAAVNLSIQGSESFPSTCDGENPPLTSAIHALTDRGIPVVVASGNAGFSNGMSLPACVSTAVSVGSHSDGLVVAGSSNASARTSVVAPGVNIESPQVTGGYSEVSGTSFAAPHVAGAFAIWAQRFPGINDEEALFLSTQHGKTILDTRNGRRYPRLFLDDPSKVLIAEQFAPSSESVGGTYQPFVGDFDGDLTDDIFWYAPGGQLDYVWTSTERSGFTSRSQPVQGTYRVAVLDQNDDGRDDLYFHGPGGVADSFWYGRADGGFDKVTVAVPGNPELLVGDFNGDSIDDLFLYEAGPAADGLIAGGVAPTVSSLQVSGSYEPLVGDYDGDSADDIFWYAPGSAPDHVWYGGGGANGFTSVARSVSGSYEPVVGDFGGDGRDDVFWYRPGSGADYLWRGTRSRGPFGSTPTSVSGTYAPVSVAADDVAGDEILWYAVPGGNDYFWTFTGSSFTSTPVAAGDGGQVLAGRFDDLGGDDLFFYRPGSSPEQVWYAIAG